MGAAELLFAQYEEDVRVMANPAEVVRMCTTMHAEFKKATLYNEELRTLPDFMKSMTSQYQTSLGLGKSFLKNSNGKLKKRTRNNRTRDSSRGSGYGYRRQGGSTRQQTSQFSPEAPASQPYTGSNSGTGASNDFDYRAGAGQGRGVCHHDQNGNCRRGASCRFLHLNR